MKRNVKKEKKWWQHLIVIPVMLAVDLIVLAAAGMADSASAGDGPGHPMPALMLAAVLIFGVLTVVLTLRALILCVRTIVRNQRGSDQNENGQYPVQGHSKKVWRCFIPLMIEIPLSIAAVIICGQAEINSFYNDPTHVGFAIPMGAILLAGFCFLLTIVLIVICVIAAVRRDSLNKENSSADTGR